MLYFKFAQRAGHVIKMNTGSFYNCRGNCNYYCNDQSEFPFVNQCFRRMAKKWQTQNCKYCTSHGVHGNVSLFLLYIQNAGDDVEV